MDPRRDADCKAMDDEALLTAVRTAPSGEALDAAWGEALARADLPGEDVAEALLLPEELTSFQRRVAEALAARAEGDAWTCRIPGTLRLVRRWLGVTPASVIDRRVPWTHEGRAVSWPLWRVWSDVPRSSLEHGQGIPRELAEALSPGELIEAAGEAVLEPYGDYGSVLEDRLMAALTHAADAAPWARTAVEAAIAVVDGDPRRHRVVDHWERQTLAVLVLLPLVRAGVPLEPAWDVLVPHTGPELYVREVLFALPPDRREAAVHRGITTTWGARGDHGDQRLLGEPPRAGVGALAPQRALRGAAVAQLLAVLREGPAEDRGGLRAHHRGAPRGRRGAQAAAPQGRADDRGRAAAGSGEEGVIRARGRRRGRPPARTSPAPGSRRSRRSTRGSPGRTTSR